MVSSAVCGCVSDVLTTCGVRAGAVVGTVSGSIHSHVCALRAVGAGAISVSSAVCSIGHIRT